MVKTPEEYFTDQQFDLSEADAKQGITTAEQAFIQKYVGEGCVKQLGIDISATAPAAIIDEPPLPEVLASQPSVQMIFYQISEQTYCIPIDAVQEVMRYIPPTTLPLAPTHVAGIINLRGRVTPLIALDYLLCNALNDAVEPGEKFIIICSRKGLQVGLIVEKIQNMLTVNQEQILWNVESQLGANTEYICGIIDFREKVYGIVSIDMIVDYIIKN